MHGRSCAIAAIRTALCAVLLCLHAQADDRVVVSAKAQPEYTAQKFKDGRPRRETYVVMEGKYYSGATVDRSIERMTFRQIVAYLAQELAKREYWPGREPRDADLLLVIDWGTTIPSVSMMEMLARTNPVPDASNSRDTLTRASQAESGMDVGGVDLLSGFGADVNLNADFAFDLLQQQSDENDVAATQTNTAGLLGYTETLRKYQNGMLPAVNEITLRRTLEQERYFVIVQAYDMRRWQKGRPNPVLWSVRLNIGSPGNNFGMAMSRMSKAGLDFFGRTTGEATTVRSKAYDGSVKVAPLVILGEVK
jgi:hypothetical protein